MKKIICMLLACVFLLTMCPSAVATTEIPNKIDSERTVSITCNVIAFLNATNYKNTLDTPVPMYNLNEEIESLYYPLKPAGYLIASYKDGHIIEFSPEAQRFTKTSGKLYYNGIMEYYEAIDDRQLIQALSNKKVEKTDLQSTFNRTYIEQIPSIGYQLPISAYGVEPNNPTPIAANCVKCENDYWCVITAITNLLQYYHDFMNADVYASNVNSATSLRRFLNQGGPEAGYLYGKGMFLFHAVDRYNFDGKFYSGLPAYFKRSDVDTYNITEISVGKASISQVKTQLNTYARPVVLGLNTNSVDPTSAGRHAILAYTYMETNNTTYFIVNDGWGNNSVYVCADDIVIPEFELMYLS